MKNPNYTAAVHQRIVKASRGRETLRVSSELGEAAAVQNAPREGVVVPLRDGSGSRGAPVAIERG